MIKRDILSSGSIKPAHYQFVTSVIYFKQMWDSAVVAINILVAVYRHQ